MSAKLKEAAKHYRLLRARMEKEDPETLAWYEGDRAGWRYDRITKEEFLVLAYRVVWTSGFRAQTVFDKQDAYFAVLRRHLYPKKRTYAKAGRRQFLDEVASVLGGSATNRKNVAFVKIIDLIETQGWDGFRRVYLTRTAGVEERLKSLPMIGPVTVKLMLNQTGLRDTAKNDIWVTRFAAQHGFDDPLECVRQVSKRCGDDQTTIDAVLFWAGRTHALRCDRSAIGA